MKPAMDRVIRHQREAERRLNDKGLDWPCAQRSAVAEKDHAVSHAIYGRHGTFGRGVDAFADVAVCRTDDLHLKSVWSPTDFCVYAPRWVESPPR
jgi:hypothetical protein